MQSLVSFKIVSTKQADLAFEQFCLMHEEVFGVTNINGISRLNDFFFQILKISKYSELASVLKTVLAIRHGQSDIERGFSCNVNLLEDNIKDDSIVSKWLVEDHLPSNNLNPHVVEIASQLRTSCR